MMPGTVEPRIGFLINGNRIEGFDGCNSFSGILGEKLSLNTSRMGCQEGVRRLSLDLNDATSHLNSGTLENDVLLLPARSGLPAARYTRVR